MINNVVLVGRLVADPVSKDINGKNVCEIKLALQRPFKIQNNNTYETDFIKVQFWDYLALTIKEYALKGATVGVIARLQNRITNVNDKPFEIIDVVANSITFISKPYEKTNIELDNEKED